VHCIKRDRSLASFNHPDPSVKPVTPHIGQLHRSAAAILKRTRRQISYRTGTPKAFTLYRRLVCYSGANFECIRISGGQF